jgi:ring-1,2-phenylacetyl-CoA epoxidase subunit PaaE
MEFLKAKVIRKENEGANAASIWFETTPAYLKDYKPGQYLNIRHGINGKTELRAYSISGVEGFNVRIGVKRVEGGLISNLLVNDIAEGNELEISFPEGRFILPDSARKVIFIGGGSGITPVISQLNSFLERGVSAEMFLVNRTPEEAMYQDELMDLADRYPEKFKLKEYFSGSDGRCTQEKIQDWIKEDLSRLQVDTVSLCGPEGLMNTAEKALGTFGFGSHKILKEYFFISEAEEVSNVTNNENMQPLDSAKITFIVDGDEEEVEFSGDKSFLQAGLDAGIDLPYSCQGGICSSCEAVVNEGQVKMIKNMVLTDGEIAEGRVLLCQCLPLTPEVTVEVE